MSEPVLSTQTLLYFVKIAELGSLTAASRVLRVSQPSLSVAIKKLEGELGTSLFVRDRRGVTLTATGESLLGHARHVLRTLHLAREEIHGLETEPRGEFIIGVHESLAAYLLPGFMAKFLRAHPGIQLSLWNGTSREVERAVAHREVDVGLVVNPEGHDDFVVREMFTDRIELVATASLKRRIKRVSTLVSSHPLIYTPEIRQVCQVAEDVATIHEPTQRLHCSSLELVKSLMLDGVGIAVLPFRVATYAVAAGRVVPVSGKLPYFVDHVCLVRRYDMHETAAARLLLDGLRAHGEGMPPLAARRG